MRIKVKGSCTINQICWYILLFFGLFDSARNYTYLPFWFGYLKDGTIFLLIIFNLKKIKLKKVSGKLFYVMFLIICALSFQGFFYSRYNWTEVLIGIIKYMEFFFLILLFLNWDSVFSISMSKAVRQYVYIGVPILIAVNIIGYYIPNPIVSRTIWNGKLAYGYYGGRITVGQPPIAIYPVIMAYIYLLIYDRNYKRLLIYLAAIIMAVSNTGLVAVVMVMSVIFLYEEFISKERKLSRKYFYFLAVIIIGAFLIFPLFKERFSQQWELYQKKIIAVLRGGGRCKHGRTGNSLEKCNSENEWCRRRVVWKRCVRLF